MDIIGIIIIGVLIFIGFGYFFYRLHKSENPINLNKFQNTNKADIDKAREKAKDVFKLTTIKELRNGKIEKRKLTYTVVQPKYHYCKGFPHLKIDIWVEGPCPVHRPWRHSYHKKVCCCPDCVWEG